MVLVDIDFRGRVAEGVAAVVASNRYLSKKSVAVAAATGSALLEEYSSRPSSRSDSDARCYTL